MAAKIATQVRFDEKMYDLLRRIAEEEMRSINAQNSPLYVVDGIPLMSESGIETLNPRDIESIDILKDASATAI